jgi:mono/diheme cytochrome c family protein
MHSARRMKVDMNVSQWSGLLAIAAIALMTSPTFAQTPAGSLAMGHTLAQTFCRECHQIDVDDAKPRADVPGFPAVAAMPATTALSLRAFLLSNHPSMPNYQLAPDQIDSVIAFILSLKGK